MVQKWMYNIIRLSCWLVLIWRRGSNLQIIIYWRSPLHAREVCCIWIGSLMQSKITNTHATPTQGECLTFTTQHPFFKRGFNKYALYFSRELQQWLSVLFNESFMHLSPCWCPHLFGLIWEKWLRKTLNMQCNEFYGVLCDSIIQHTQCANGSSTCRVSIIAWWRYFDRSTCAFFASMICIWMFHYFPCLMLWKSHSVAHHVTCWSAPRWRPQASPCFCCNHLSRLSLPAKTKKHHRLSQWIFRVQTSLDLCRLNFPKNITRVKPAELKRLRFWNNPPETFFCLYPC